MKKLIIFATLCMFLIMPLLVQAQTTYNTEGTEANSSIYMEGSEEKRNVPNSVLPGFPQGPSYFSDVPMTEEFMGIEDLARVNAEWSRVNIKSWAGRWDDEDMENVEYTERVVRSYYNPSDKLKLSFANPAQGGATFVGILKAKAKKDTDMEAVISVLMENAINNGANIMYPINQGAKRVLSASAIGAAFGYVHIVIGGGSENAAGAGTSGFGWSRGETSYRHEPFMRVAIYKVKDDVYKNVPTFPNNGHNMEDQLKQQVRALQQKVRQYQQEAEAR